MSEFSAYESGKAAFSKGTKKYSDDKKFMEILSQLERGDRVGKAALVDEGKKGRADAEAEAAAPVEAPKKKKKKTSKKKSKK